MVKLTKEDANKLGQILKELNEMKDVLKGGEGSGVRGHRTEEEEEEERERKFAENRRKAKELRNERKRAENLY